MNAYRKILLTLLSFGIVFSLCACSSSTSSPTDNAESPAETASTEANTDGEKILRVAGESWHVSKIYLEDAAKAFMEDHPDVQVEIVTYADKSVLSTYSLDWANGSTDVDLVFLDGIAYAQQFAAKDLIYDYEKDLNFFDSYDETLFSPGVVDFGRINGNLFLMPIIYEVYGVDINLEMFRQAGLVDEAGNPLVPKTWEEFYEFAQKLTIRDESGNITQQGASINWGDNMLGVVSSALAAQNGHIVGDDGVSMDFDNDGFREILNDWKKGVKDGCFSIETFADTSAGRNNYKAGNVAMIFESASRWIEASEMLGIDNVSVLPSPGLQGTTGNTNGVVIPKCSANADLAIQFICEQLLEEHVQTSTLNVYGKLPVIAEYYAMADSPVWSNLDVQMDNILPFPSYEEIGRFTDEMINIIQAGLTDDSISADDIISQLDTMMATIRKQSHN